LTWTNVPNATSYNLYSSTNPWVWPANWTNVQGNLTSVPMPSGPMFYWLTWLNSYGLESQRGAWYEYQKPQTNVVDISCGPWSNFVTNPTHSTFFYCDRTGRLQVSGDLVTWVTWTNLGKYYPPKISERHL
jgi:hypothetical protein